MVQLQVEKEKERGLSCLREKEETGMPLFSFCLCWVVPLCWVVLFCCAMCLHFNPSSSCSFCLCWSRWHVMEGGWRRKANVRKYIACFQPVAVINLISNTVPFLCYFWSWPTKLFLLRNTLPSIFPVNLDCNG